MNEKIMIIVRLLIAILPFVLLSFVSIVINLKRVNRSRQLLVPMVSWLYVLITMWKIDDLYDKMMEFINGIPMWFFEQAYKYRTTDLEELLNNLGLLAEEILDRFNFEFWMFFIINTLVMIVYLLIKLLTMFISKIAVKPKSTLFSKVATIFYEFVPDKNIWCLKENYVQVRSIFKVFYIGAIIITSLLMLISRNLYFIEVIKGLFYPVFTVILVGELYFYLNGMTKKEYVGYVLGESDDAQKNVNYTLLKKFLRSVFGDKLLAENTGTNNALVSDLSIDDVLYRLEESDDPKEVSFATYYKSVHRAGKPIDYNYLCSSLDMLNGKSILFNNPFYNDLIPYAFYPMNRALLNHKKVLIVLGRHAIENDIEEWVKKGVESVTNIPFIWNIGVLNDQSKNPDIGIITRSDVLNIKMHNTNTDFFEKVGFFVIIEPSKLISTSQIGLNFLVKQCHGVDGSEPVYCMCDKNCDGLVDAMSHILMTDITEVSATNKHSGTSSYMCWETDGDYLHHRLVPNISRYLGMGTELSFAALRNQVSKTTWFGGEAFPVTDMHWIGKQYYYDLTKYAGLPGNQEVMDDCFITSPNLWGAMVEKNNYITVEDESNNMFEVLRDFSTRTTDQGFINVISSEYLLKDYMAENASIFESDAKAIPCIVADHIRSNRNVVLRLILMMSTFKVPISMIEKEFSLLGIRIYDLKKQLWYEMYTCFSTTEQVKSLPDRYELAVEAAYFRKIIIDSNVFGAEIIQEEEVFALKKSKMELTFSITHQDFLSICASELKSAGYISEDEQGERHYLGSELSGHIYQKYLPGQFFTFGGKYYEMQYLTADGQILVRRAADHITGRPSYRQIRKYTLNGINSSDKIATRKNVEGMRVIKEFADIVVDTEGYFLMEKYNDFAQAKKISFEGEGNGIPTRKYHNKEILRVELPDMDGKLTDNIRYTITLLFNEVFRTLFAENQAYICALTDDSFITDEGKPFTYTLKGEGCEIDKNSIYIIEDSQLDLGLAVAVERNLDRIFKIIYDYIDWHFDALEEALKPPQEPVSEVTFEVTDEAEDQEEQSEGREKKWNWFKKKDKKEEQEIMDEDEPVLKLSEDENLLADPESEPLEDQLIEDEPVLNLSMEQPTAQESDLDLSADQEDYFYDEPLKSDHRADEMDLTQTPNEEEPVTYIHEETPQNAEEGFVVKRPPYNERHYLLFGGDSERAYIDLASTMEYLAGMDMDKNPLKQAREGKKIAELVEASFKPGKPDARYCDFCGAEIYGVEYETLADGRDRCLTCSRTAIKTSDEFRRIFKDVKQNMEVLFGIRINTGIRVEMVNSKTLHRRLGQAFVPTPDSDGRCLGVAINEKNGYTLLVENGSPRMASILTMVHELTHIWQFINWNDRYIRKLYGKDMRLEIYEGMAKWAEVQYAYLINEGAIARREEIINAYREDEYGRGFLRYRANYPFSTGSVLSGPTPFQNPLLPLAPEYCGAITVTMPTGGEPSYEEEPTPTVPPVSEAVKGSIDRDPQAFERFAYQKLTQDEQRLYDVAYDAIINFAPEITSFPIETGDEQMSKIIEYIQRDHPEIFWFQHGATYFFDAATHVVQKVELVYCLTPEQTKIRQNEIQTALAPFMNCIHNQMSDYEVALKVYENIIKLVDYDTLGLEGQGMNSPKATVPDDLRSIYGVFVNKKAVCSGYAKATQYLLNLCGIECTYVTGDSHAWNLLKLEGEYYHLDTTWGDSSDTKQEKSKGDYINYDCFCITTQEVKCLESHSYGDELPLPECTAVKCNYHYRQGCVFDRLDLNVVREVTRNAIQSDILDLSVKFTSREIYSLSKQQLIDEGEMSRILQYCNMKVKNRVNTGFTYSSRDELMVINFHFTGLQ